MTYNNAIYKSLASSNDLNALKSLFCDKILIFLLLLFHRRLDNLKNLKFLNLIFKSILFFNQNYSTFIYLQ